MANRKGSDDDRALAALEASGESLLDYIQRHVSGDSGIVDDRDRRENETAIIIHMRIMSVYPSSPDALQRSNS